jgi:hypothetical protein
MHWAVFLMALEDSATAGACDGIRGRRSIHWALYLMASRGGVLFDTHLILRITIFWVPETLQIEYYRKADPLLRVIIHLQIPLFVFTCFA